MARIIHDLLITDCPPKETLPPLKAVQSRLSEDELQAQLQERFNEGLLQGRREGRELQGQETKAQIEQQKKELQQLIQQIPAELIKARHQLKEESATLVLTIVERLLIQRQLDKGWIFEQVNLLLNELNKNQQVELFMHPNDLARLQQGDFLLQTKGIKGITIAADEQLRLGGCRLKTDQGYFDLNIEKQIDRLKKLLLKIQLGEALV